MEILQTIVSQETPTGWIGSAIMALGALVCCYAFGDYNSYRSESRRKNRKIVFIISIILAISASFLSIYTAFNDVGEVHTYYRVAFDESVNMKEFVQKYNVIRQEGFTYIVEENKESLGW